jgi:hypothetical protein
MAQIKLNATYGLTGTLPAVSGANLTSLTSGNLTGALPAISGASLTTLNASNVSSGTLNAARYSGGKILQVVQAYINDDVSTTNTTWTAITGFEVDITPSATSSKILILASAGCEKGGTSSDFGAFTLYKDDSTNLGETTYGFGLESAEGGYARGFLSLNWLDSPSTTSSVNYQIYMKNNASDSIKVGGGNASSVIIAMEVGA